MAFHLGDENNNNNNNNKGEYLRCIGWMEKNDTTASPKIGILLTNSGFFGDLRNFDFIFWKLRNSFLLAQGPCRPCQQNFDLKFDFNVSTESGILQFQKRWIWWRNLDFVRKFALVWKGSYSETVRRIYAGSPLYNLRAIFRG